MALEKIKKLLENCDYQELLNLDKHLSELLREAESRSKELQEKEGRERRREERFETNLLGTLTRITDVKPGERKEYSVTIQDVSRSGMGLKLENNFIPSRVVEVTFASPGGKIKRCFLEVVRMQKKTNQDGSWLEVGCRSVSNEEVRRLRLQEEQLTKMRSKLHNRSSIMILIVGSEMEVLRLKILNRLKNHGYCTRRVDSLHMAMRSGERIHAQLTIIANGSEVCMDAMQLEVLKQRPAGMAIMAIVDRQDDIMPMILAGVDECLTEDNYENYLFQTIERAILGHAVRHGRKDRQLSGRALVVSFDNSRLNLVSYQLEENGYNYHNVSSVEELKRLANTGYDLVLVDYESNSKEEFDEVMTKFSDIPVIAMCDDLADGQNAIVDGAGNYLCMPPNKDDMRMILELTGAKVKSTI